MQVIIDFFKGFADVITSLVDFVIGMVEDLVYVITLLGEFATQIPAYFSWLPEEALVLVVSGIGLVVIYKVLGREG